MTPAIAFEKFAHCFASAKSRMGSVKNRLPSPTPGAAGVRW